MVNPTAAVMPGRKSRGASIASHTQATQTQSRRISAAGIDRGDTKSYAGWSWWLWRRCWLCSPCCLCWQVECIARRLPKNFRGTPVDPTPRRQGGALDAKVVHSTPGTRTRRPLSPGKPMISIGWHAGGVEASSASGGLQEFFAGVTQPGRHGCATEASGASGRRVDFESFSAVPPSRSATDATSESTDCAQRSSR
jgi:hypothetical protein